MEKERKFARFVMEFEVEIVDPVAASAMTMDWSADEDGGIGMRTVEDDVERVRGALGHLLTAAMVEHGARAGVKWQSSSLMRRYEDGKGSYHELTLGPMPVRRADGSTDENWMPPRAS